MVIKALGKQLRQFKNNTFFLYLCLNGILLNERGFVGWDHYGGVLHEILNDWSLGEQLILFCFYLHIYVSRDGAEGDIEIRRKQNELFPEGPVLKWLFDSWKFIKPRCINGGRRSAVHCHLLTSQILQCCPLRDFGGKQFHC